MRKKKPTLEALAEQTTSDHPPQCKPWDAKLPPDLAKEWRAFLKKQLANPTHSQNVLAKITRDWLKGNGFEPLPGRTAISDAFRRARGEA